MQVSQAIELLSKNAFKYVDNTVHNHTVTEYQTFTLDKDQFFFVLPRISCCGFRPSLEETVEYILAREFKLVRLYSDYNGNPYCPTGFFDLVNEITFWYETSSGTVIEMTVSENDEPLYQIEIPCSRAGGFHDLMVRMALAGATPELFEIKHNFWNVTEAEYKKYTPWWNSTNLGEKLPSWEEYDRQQKEKAQARENERLAKIEQQKAAGTWYDGEIEVYDDYDYEEVGDIE